MGFKPIMDYNSIGNYVSYTISYIFKLRKEKNNEYRSSNRYLYRFSNRYDYSIIIYKKIILDFL